MAPPIPIMAAVSLVHPVGTESNTTLANGTGTAAQEASQGTALDNDEGGMLAEETHKKMTDRKQSDYVRCKSEPVVAS